jgi:hypothetical protein
VTRKDIFNELLFYELDPNYVYGGAEDDDINFTVQGDPDDDAEKGDRRQRKIDLRRIF